MGSPCRLAVALVLAFVGPAFSQERPSALPPAEPREPIKDLTPPEFLTAVEQAPHAEPPAGGWYAAVEFLFLTPRERGLDFAIVDAKNDLVPAGSVQSLNYRAQPGLRTTLAYHVPGHAWDIGLTYTYFQSTDHFGVTAPEGGLLYPTLTRAGLTNEATTALGRTRLTVNVYDLEIGRHWEADETFRLRLYGGLRIATIRQFLSANYEGRDADGAFASVASNFDGVGPLIGTESWWGLAGGLGAFGRANAGLLTGTMRSPFTETNNGGATTYADLRERYALTVPFVSLGIGLAWEYRGLTVRAGYEVTNWFNLFERPTFVDDFAEGKFVKRTSGLALDGFFVQVGLSF